MFKLVRYFSLSSLIAFIIVTILLGGLYRHIAVDQLIVLREENNVALTQVFANTTWIDFRQFVSTASDEVPINDLPQHAETQRLRETIIEQTAGLSIVKVKVYNLDALTIFSTEAAQIGDLKSDNAGYLAARRGEVASELTHRDQFSAFEQTIEDRDVISSYVPIRQGGSDGAIEGVFEVYDDVTPLLVQIDNTQRTIILSVVIVLTVLYLILQGIVRYADHIMKHQREQRDQAVAARQASEAQYGSLINNMSEGVVHLDLEGCIHFANPRFCEMLELTPQAIIGKSKHDVLQLVLGESTNTLNADELHIKKSSGDTLCVQVRHAAIEDIYGVKTGVVEIYTDITELKQTEANLKVARDDALAASRLKSQILANVSHDARTPLSAMSLRLEMLDKEHYGDLNPKQHEALKMIGHNTKRLGNFINNLLDAAQLEAGKITLHTSSFVPQELLKDVESSMQSLAEVHGLVLETQHTNDLPDNLIGDVNYIHRIIQNLVENAIKFTETGAIRIQLSADETPGYWSIRVSDTGAGIPRDAQQQLFEAFYQVDDNLTQSQKQAGVGLGLSIVKQLTDLMDGKITLESELGVGTTFIIRLPIVPQLEEITS